MNSVILWYTGLFLLMCGIGMLPNKTKHRMIYMRSVVPIIMIEPMIAQKIHIKILPQTLLISILVNGLEFGGYLTGWLLNKKFMKKEKIKIDNV